uniref:Disease resistance R13L4/SHOC-2-like LRR domain-containing protein n=1 Tax=Kalanchoe fedtschenkoi TaxID=63787 RepID=A0A7N0TNS6_KALFE
MAHPLLIPIVMFLISEQCESKTHWADVQVLRHLKQALDPNSVPPASCVSTWDFSVDPCDNLYTEKFTCGFTCDLVAFDGTTHITDIQLDHAGYSGSIVSVPWPLTPHLRSLDLSTNYLSGSIPSSLSSLLQLRRLALSSNSFSGHIPNSIGILTNLEELYLNSNRFTGTVPHTFNGLQCLKRLELQQNKLSGPFPDLGSLPNLSFLDASDNTISGELPANFPTNLVQLTMRSNALQGTIPESLQHLNYLQVIDLSHNRLSGSVPHFLFSHQSLQQLTLTNNHFTSVQIPASFGTQSNLIALDVSQNQLQGLLPGFLAFMPRLSALSLENNIFTGFIPIQYALKAVFPPAGVSPWMRLLLGGNYLYGPIPSPFLGMKAGSATVNLAGNCFHKCPISLFFCQAAPQKSVNQCKNFVPVIP